jgi:hypothetical protein
LVAWHVAAGKEGRLRTLSVSAFATFLVSCSETVTQTAPDYGPVGDGMKVIGYALIAVAVIITLGRLL